MINNKIPQEIEDEIINKIMDDDYYHPSNWLSPENQNRAILKQAISLSFKAGQKQNLDFTDGFREGRLYEQNKFKKMIEDLQKKVRRMLIDNSKCDCTEWTTRYGDISDVCFWEFISKIGDVQQSKEKREDE